MFTIMKAGARCRRQEENAAQHGPSEQRLSRTFNHIAIGGFSVMALACAALAAWAGHDLTALEHETPPAVTAPMDQDDSDARYLDFCVMIAAVIGTVGTATGAVALMRLPPATAEDPCSGISCRGPGERPEPPS